MRNNCVQTTIEDICSDVSKSTNANKPVLIELPESHIDFETLIPENFYHAFYRRYGRSHFYHLERYPSIAVIRSDNPIKQQCPYQGQQLLKIARFSTLSSI